MQNKNKLVLAILFAGLNMGSAHAATYLEKQPIETDVLVHRAFQNSKYQEFFEAQKQGVECKVKSSVLEDFFKNLFKQKLALFDQIPTRSKPAGEVKHGERFLKFRDVISKREWAILVLKKENQPAVSELLKRLSGARDFSKIETGPYLGLSEEPAMYICLYVLNTKFREVADKQVGRYKLTAAGVLPVVPAAMAADASQPSGAPHIVVTSATGDLPVISEE